MPRILVVYFSRTGHTRTIAKQLAAKLDASVEEIFDPTRRAGFFGYQRSGFQAFFRRLPPIAPSVHNPREYDLVVIGTPVWDMSLSAPVRAYLRRHHAELPRLAFFCTCGGVGGERAFAQMSEECGQQPIATMVLTERELTTSAVPISIARFIAQIRTVMGMHRAGVPATGRRTA